LQRRAQSPANAPRFSAIPAHHVGDGPCHCRQVHELVWLLVVRLEMSVEDLVYALMLFETMAREHPGLLAVHNMRRLYLACCSLAVKINRDVRLAMGGIHADTRANPTLSLTDLPSHPQPQRPLPVAGRLRCS